MRQKLTEADFDSVGLTKRAVELAGVPVREEDVALALKWMEGRVRKGSVLKPALQSTVGAGAFAVAALRSGYRVVRETKGSHTVKINMLVTNERASDWDWDWDTLIDMAIQNDGVFTVVQADQCGITKKQLHQHVLDGTFERVARGLLRLSTGEKKRAPVAATHIRVTTALHGRLLATQKQLSVSMTEVVEKALDALEREVATSST